MASRQEVVVARRPDVLRDEMLCPIPAVNWKEETGSRRVKEPNSGIRPVVANSAHRVLDGEACPIAPQDWRSLSQGAAPGRKAAVARKTKKATTKAGIAADDDEGTGRERGTTAAHARKICRTTVETSTTGSKLALAPLTKIGVPASTFATPTFFAASQSVDSALIMSPRPATATSTSSSASSDIGAPSGTSRSSSGSSGSSGSSRSSSSTSSEEVLEVAAVLSQLDASTHEVSLAPSPALSTASPRGKSLRALARHTSELCPSRGSSELAAGSDTTRANCAQDEIKPLAPAAAYPVDLSSRGSTFSGLIKCSPAGPLLSPLFPSYASSAAASRETLASKGATATATLFPSAGDLLAAHAAFNPGSSRAAVEPPLVAARRATADGVKQFPVYQARDVFAGTSPTDQAVTTSGCADGTAGDGTANRRRRRFSETSSREEAIRAGIEMGMVMGVGVEIGQRCRDTTSKGTAEAGDRNAAAVSCADWSELSHLCGRMDAAGIRIEQIDLTTLGDTVDDIAIW
ncbi:hypothetical protein CLOM_g13018 [Closterium sp. NIES-68]|nr:hypothetical protein CLOM_g13018 [Closterium sp. NIES-68]GJP84091.1 hypothetical protein CLOP_g14178 [Closterium sp. NIES-67]